jgi:hypothetical protein
MILTLVWCLVLIVIMLSIHKNREQKGHLYNASEVKLIKNDNGLFSAFTHFIITNLGDGTGCFCKYCKSKDKEFTLYERVKPIQIETITKYGAKITDDMFESTGEIYCSHCGRLDKSEVCFYREYN